MLREDPHIRLSSAEVLEELKKVYPNNEDPIPYVPHPHSTFRLEGDGKTFKIFKDIFPILVELDLQFVEIDAATFTSSLEKCNNVSKISMSVHLKDGNMHFKKIKLPQLKSFFLRILNCHIDPKFSELTLNSIYFVGPFAEALES